MKVVLSTPPGRTTERWPPLGLLYLASSVRATRSDTVRVIDAFCENLSTGDLLHRVVREKPDLFGMNCSTHTFLDTMDAMKSVHAVLPGTRLVLGGFHATFAAERILRDYPLIDFVIKGEAEHGFPKLLAHLEDGTEPSDVDGITYLDGAKVVSQPLAITQDLDALPFPARDLVEDIAYGYAHNGIRLTFGKFTTLCSSRGCPFRCTYCSCAAFSQRRWRPRSPENVVDEIERLQEEGYECAVFVDDNFTLKHKRVEEICRLLRERKVRMRFYCEGRVDHSPYGLLRTMKQAGFDVMYYGVESVSPHVLEYYKKGITAEKSRQAIADAKRAGMLVVVSYIIGAPVESREDILRTIRFIQETRTHGIQVNILDCLIGTPIWEDFVRAGIVKPDDWKRNHRIYEYRPDGLSREALEELAEKGYEAYVQGWKSREGVRDLLRLLWNNPTGRKVIFGNLLRVPEVRRMSQESRLKAALPDREGPQTPLAAAARAR
ncbi:MAG TPA: radical SAM protein [Thermoplasmata archaeon]|nr:radical SAM protein [Thermoplasmata archaeon]